MTVGATPQRLPPTTLRPGTSFSCAITFRRKALSLPMLRLMSPVMRRYLSLPMPIVARLKSYACAVLVTRLTPPPADARPPSTEFGPFTTSTCSMAKISRDCEPASRMPSMYVSVCAL